MTPPDTIASDGPITGKRTFKAVIFDFDGVIVESGRIKSQAFVELFADASEHHAAILQYHLDHLGVSRYRKFEWIYDELLKRSLNEEESRRLGEAFSSIVLRKIIECPYVPGAYETLERLRNRSPMFVASGTPHEELHHIIASRGLVPFFREAWGSPAEKVDIIESILSRYHFVAGEVLFIGDGFSDYKAAVETGVGFLARENGTGDVDWEGLGMNFVLDLTSVPGLMA